MLLGESVAVGIEMSTTLVRYDPASRPAGLHQSLLSKLVRTTVANSGLHEVKCMVEDLYWLITRVVPLLKEFVARAHVIGSKPLLPSERPGGHELSNLGFGKSPFRQPVVSKS